MKPLAKLERKIQIVDFKVGSAVAVERIRGWKLTKIRERILLRDQYTCRKCGRVSVDLVVDHITPLHLGGSESDENRQALCPIPCHRDKTELEEKVRCNRSDRHMS